MALDQGVVDGVTNANFKTIAETVTVALANAQAMQLANATAHQQRLNMIAETVVGEMLLQRAGADVSEAASVREISTADLGEKLSELGAAISGIQQLLKGAQTTIPQTGQQNTP